MTAEPFDTSDFLQRVADGDERAVHELFRQHRDRLKRMIRLRLDSRLTGRVDESDVLQEAYLEVVRRLEDYRRDLRIPVFLWLRHLTGLKLTELHRRHLGTQMRDAGREVSLHRGPLPEANSASLAAQLLGKITSPPEAAVKAERRLMLQEALNGMDPLDREILALRHFEQLSNLETAEALNLPASTAADRHLQAIKRLRKILSQRPGFPETDWT